MTFVGLFLATACTCISLLFGPTTNDYECEHELKTSTSSNYSQNLTVIPGILLTLYSLHSSMEQLLYHTSVFLNLCETAAR